MTLARYVFKPARPAHPRRVTPVAKAAEPPGFYDLTKQLLVALKQPVPDSSLIGALQRGVEDLLNALGFDDLSAQLRQILLTHLPPAWIDGYDTVPVGGITSGLPAVGPAIGERATADAMARAAQLVVEITQETREAIRTVVTRGLQEGLSVPHVAQRVKPLIGLHTQWANAVSKYHGTQYDSLIARGFTPAQADARSAQLAQAYADRLLNRRSENIARTELLRASNAGRVAGLRDIAQSGDQLMWLTAEDERTCSICQPLNGEKISLHYGMFSVGVEYPPAHPSCRCTVIADYSLSKALTPVFKSWVASDHPRDSKGRFMGGGGGGGGGHSGGGGGVSLTEATGESDSKLLPDWAEVQGMKKIAGPLGSQGGQWYEDGNGTQYLLKPAKSEKHAWNEVATGELYRQVDPANTPNTRVVKGLDGKAYVLSEKVNGLQAWDGTPASQHDARRLFGVDALTGNRDVAGLSMDNALIGPGGHVVRVDFGGGMAFRAQGSPKENFKSGGDWMEPVSLRTSTQGKALYGHPTEADVAASMQAAKKINLPKVEQAWKDAGVPQQYVNEWGAVLAERQAQIKEAPGAAAGAIKRAKVNPDLSNVKIGDEVQMGFSDGKWSDAAKVVQKTPQGIVVKPFDGPSMTVKPNTSDVNGLHVLGEGKTVTAHMPTPEPFTGGKISDPTHANSGDTIINNITGAQHTVTGVEQIGSKSYVVSETAGGQKQYHDVELGNYNLVTNIGPLPSLKKHGEAVNAKDVQAGDVIQYKGNHSYTVLSTHDADGKEQWTLQNVATGQKINGYSPASMSPSEWKYGVKTTTTPQGKPVVTPASTPAPKIVSAGGKAGEGAGPLPKTQSAVKASNKQSRDDLKDMYSGKDPSVESWHLENGVTVHKLASGKHIVFTNKGNGAVYSKSYVSESVLPHAAKKPAPKGVGPLPKTQSAIKASSKDGRDAIKDYYAGKVTGNLTHVDENTSVLSLDDGRILTLTNKQGAVYAKLEKGSGSGFAVVSAPAGSTTHAAAKLGKTVADAPPAIGDLIQGQPHAPVWKVTKVFPDGSVNGIAVKGSDAIPEGTTKGWIAGSMPLKNMTHVASEGGKSADALAGTTGAKIPATTANTKPGDTIQIGESKWKVQTVGAGSSGTVSASLLDPQGNVIKGPFVPLHLASGGAIKVSDPTGGKLDMTSAIPKVPVTSGVGHGPLPGKNVKVLHQPADYPLAQTHKDYLDGKLTILKEQPLGKISTVVTYSDGTNVVFTKQKDGSTKISGFDQSKLPTQSATSSYSYSTPSGTPATHLEQNLGPAHGTVIALHEASSLYPPSKIPAESKSALKTYTGSSYTSINSHLRAGGKPTAQDKKRMAGMLRTPAHADIVVHRNTGYSQFGGVQVNEGMVGTVFQDKGFLSTSVGGKSNWSGDVKMEIEVPKGVPVAYVQPFSSHPTENEMVLHPGLKYEVLGVSPYGNGHAVRVRVVWPDPTFSSPAAP